MIEVPNFFINLSVALTLFFLCPEKFSLTHGVAQATNVSLLRFFFFFFLAFDIWFIRSRIFNLF